MQTDKESTEWGDEPDGLIGGQSFSKAAYPHGQSRCGAAENARAQVTARQCMLP